MSRLPTERARPAPSRRERGFSLLEVLVAFVILTLVATALFRLFSGALNNAGAADDYSRAVLVAQSVLEESSAGPLREGTRSGDADDGRLQWTAQIAPYDAPAVNPDLERVSAAMPIRMFRISTTVTFASPMGGQRSLSLATIRIGRREAQ